MRLNPPVADSCDGVAAGAARANRIRRGARRGYGGIVRLFRENWRGPTRAKSYLLDDRYVVTVLRDTMTTVERTRSTSGISIVRMFGCHQEAMAASSKKWSSGATAGVGRNTASDQRSDRRRVLLLEDEKGQISGFQTVIAVLLILRGREAQEGSVIGTPARLDRRPRSIPRNSARAIMMFESQPHQEDDRGRRASSRSFDSRSGTVNANATGR